MTTETQLVDRQAVIDVVTTLFIETDQRNWDAVKACFAPKVHFDMTSLAGGEAVDLAPEDIVGAWKKGLEPIHAVHHQIGNFRVTILGDEASVYCYGVAYHHRPVRSGRNVRRFVGSYDLRLERAERGWKVDHFRFNAKFVDGNLELDQEEPA